MSCISHPPPPPPLLRVSDAAAPVTILFPCGPQKLEFLEESLDSVLSQSSPNWQLLIGLDETSPAWVSAWVNKLDDPRVKCVVAQGSGFARILNHMAAAATTEFVTILLSDDRYATQAIATIERYVAQEPEIDFFHSARCCINARGERIGPVYASKPSFSLDEFKLVGSPVKHLLCWRRAVGLRIGGMDEELSCHGCDDYDFPWRMAEAGARFRAISECLYEYREHNEGPRLTTSTPLDRQVQTIERMFNKHGVSRVQTSAYLQQAARGYLAAEACGVGVARGNGPALIIHCYREALADTWDQFAACGWKRRHFFAHRLSVVRRPGPDGSKLAQSMCAVSDPGKLHEAILYCLPDAAPADVPPEIYFDDDIAWHQQQLGLPFQVAHANLVMRDDALYITLLCSDLVQRISRRRQYKTRIESTYKGWIRILLNGIMNHAIDAGIKKVYLPTSKLSLENTDPAREVSPALFQRIYDSSVNSLYSVEFDGNWQKIDVGFNASRVVPLARRLEAKEPKRTISIAHDIEHGLGHQSNKTLAAKMNREAPLALPEMLKIEAACQIQTTYNVVGQLLPQLRNQIEGQGHSLGFHAFDHSLPQLKSLRGRLRALLGLNISSLEGTRTREFEQLALCRQQDYRLKGYRPPQSKLGPGLFDTHLSYFNFEWFASSRSSLDIEQPILENGIVKIPIHIDDYDLHIGKLSYRDWQTEVFSRVAENNIATISLHDCYAEHWLPHYRELLCELAELGEFQTFDQICNDQVLGSSSWV